VFGAALGGVIAAAIGLALCFTFNALSFAAVLVSLAAMRTSELFPGKQVTRQKRQVRQGLRYVRRTPALLIPLVLIALIGTLAWEFQVSLPLMASNVFHGGAASYGVMASVMGAGAVVGGLISAARSRPRARALCLAAVGWGIAILAAAVAPSMALELAALVFVGYGSITFNSLAKTPPQAGGRAGGGGRGGGVGGGGLAGLDPERRAVRGLGRPGDGGPRGAGHRRRGRPGLRGPGPAPPDQDRPAHGHAGAPGARR